MTTADVKPILGGARSGKSGYALEQEAAPGRCLVVDWLMLWLSNCLLLLDAASWFARKRALLVVVARAHKRLLLASNELGCGIVPDNALARRFRDEAGWQNQALAARVPHVTLVVAGLAVPVKRCS